MVMYMGEQGNTPENVANEASAEAVESNPVSPFIEASPKSGDLNGAQPAEYGPLLNPNDQVGVAAEGSQILNPNDAEVNPPQANTFSYEVAKKELGTKLADLRSKLNSGELTQEQFDNQSLAARAGLFTDAARVLDPEAAKAGKEPRFDEVLKFLQPLESGKIGALNKVLEGAPFLRDFSLEQLQMVSREFGQTAQIIVQEGVIAIEDKLKQKGISSSEDFSPDVQEEVTSYLMKDKITDLSRESNLKNLSEVKRFLEANVSFETVMMTYLAEQSPSSTEKVQDDTASISEQQQLSSDALTTLPSEKSSLKKAISMMGSATKREFVSRATDNDVHEFLSFILGGNTTGRYSQRESFGNAQREQVEQGVQIDAEGMKKATNQGSQDRLVALISYANKNISNENRKRGLGTFYDEVNKPPSQEEWRSLLQKSEFQKQLKFFFESTETNHATLEQLASWLKTDESVDETLRQKWQKSNLQSSGITREALDEFYKLLQKI